jgi:hypothetical protein
MTRTSIVFVTIAFVVGLAIGLFTRRAEPQPTPQATAHTADLAAIDRLHKADVAATLTQDPTAMTNLWSEDGVKIDGPNGPIVGKKAMQDLYVKTRTGFPEFKVSKYSTDIKELQIVDGWALEVGDTEATYQMSAKEGPIVVPRTQGMRVLKRQSDGSWKFALVGLK